MRSTFSLISGTLMIAAAAMLDLFQLVVSFIPFAGSVIAKLVSLATGLIVLFWLIFAGALNLRTFLWLVGAGTLEFLPIPFLDMGPFWTGGVAGIVAMVVWKEAERGRAERKASHEGQLLRQQQMEEEYEQEQAEQQAALEQEEYASQEQAVEAYA
jgi:hypothetical protein